MVYCQYCGKLAQEGEHFCKQCGKPLTEPWKPSPSQQPQRKQQTKLPISKDIEHIAGISFLNSAFLGILGVLSYGLSNLASRTGNFVFPLSNKLLFISIAGLGLVGFILSLILVIGLSSNLLWRVLMSYWFLVLAFFIFLDLSDPNYITKGLSGFFLLIPLFSAGCIIYGFGKSVKQYFSVKTESDVSSGSVITN